MRVAYIRPADGKCQLCGQEEELRPYGPGGAFVCFDCGMENREEAERRFAAILDGHDVVIIDDRDEAP